MVSEMKRWYAERTDELTRLDRDTTDDDHGIDDYYDTKENFEKAATEELGRLLAALAEHGIGGTKQGPVAYAGDETRIEGGFGEVTVSPRDGERGTLILIDSSRATSGDPLVVMVNDQVIPVPDEDGHIANERSGQPGRD